MYSVKQISKKLNVHEITVRRWIYDGKLKASKFGGQWRVRKEDLKDFSEGIKPKFKKGDLVNWIDGKLQKVEYSDIFVT